MVKNGKTWIYWEQNIIFLQNKEILNLCRRCHILRSYCFVAEVIKTYFGTHLVFIIILVHMCKRIISPVVFFSFFFKIKIFHVSRAQSDKKFCLLDLVSQEAYIIFSWFLVHMCKIVTSSGAFFHYFNIFIFQVVRGLEGQKWLKMTKNYVCLTLDLRNHTTYDFWYTCVKWSKSQLNFLFFQNSDFLVY